jgi:hypothetical protein
MFTNFDPALVAVLRAAMQLADAMRDIGAKDEMTLRLSREDGLALLRLVAGANHAQAEAFSQRGQPQRPGVSSLKVAGLTFEWPSDALAGTMVANDNRQAFGAGQRACGLVRDPTPPPPLQR